MTWTRSPHHALRLVLLSCVLAQGCEGQEAPTPQPEPVKPEPAPEPPPPEPKPAPPPPKIEIPDNCDIEIVGDKEIELALVSGADGKFIDNEIIDGHKIRIVCPEEEARRKDLDVVAQLKHEEGSKPADNIVHWSDVEVGAAAEAGAAKLDTAKATPGVPPDREEQFLAELEALGVDTAALEPEPEPEPAPTKAGPSKVKATFKAQKLLSAEIKFKDAKGKEQALTLQPNASRKLLPGTYTLQIRSPLNSDQWNDAGSFEIPADGDGVSVVLSKRPWTAKVQ